jgi:hypothetical protein
MCPPVAARERHYTWIETALSNRRASALHLTDDCITFILRRADHDDGSLLSHLCSEPSKSRFEWLSGTATERDMLAIGVSVG